MMGWIRSVALSFAPVVGIAIAATGCDRNVAPFDPEEEPRQPDLGKIFPEGAERAPAPRGFAAPGGPPAAPTAAAGAGGEPISGTIRLAEGMTPPAGAVLFIIARRGEAGPPLAVKRVVDASFPLDFRLGPEDRMIEAMPFEGPLRVTARVDGDGNASSRGPGDLQGQVALPVATGTTGLELVLDEQL